MRKLEAFLLPTEDTHGRFPSLSEYRPRAENHMENPFKVLAKTIAGKIESGCDSCSTSSGGTCGPTPDKSKTSFELTRRDSGRIAVSASVSSILAGCSPSKSP